MEISIAAGSKSSKSVKVPGRAWAKSNGFTICSAAASVNRRTQLPLVSDCLNMIKGMNWATAEPDDTPRRWRRRMLFAGITLAGLSLAVGSMFWLIQAIRARGEPVTFAELDAYYPAPPADKNAADLWLRADAALLAAEGSGSARALPYFGMSRDPPLPRQFWAELEQSRQFLAANAEAMRLLHEAPELGGQARFPGSLNTRTAATSGWLTRARQMRAGGRALMLETDVSAHEGAGRGAVESIRAGTFLAQSLASEAVMRSQLVRVAL
jgi:hypothetical protein